MEDNQGWVKLYRKMLDNPIICKDSETFAIWNYLLLNATHKETSVYFKNKKITLQKGQLITGILVISKKFKINKDKVQRTLKLFETDKQIEQETSNKNRLISILNWDKYQIIDNVIDKQLINKRETTDKQLITNKNVKKEKNDNNDKKNIYGEYKHVRLTEKELQSLESSYINYLDIIKYLDEYIEMKGYKAKNHYLCIKKWVADAVKKDKPAETKPDIWKKIAEMNGEVLE